MKNLFAKLLENQFLRYVISFIQWVYNRFLRIFGLIPPYWNAIKAIRLFKISNWKSYLKTAVGMFFVIFSVFTIYILLRLIVFFIISTDPIDLYIMQHDIFTISDPKESFAGKFNTSFQFRYYFSNVVLSSIFFYISLVLIREFSLMWVHLVNFNSSFVKNFTRVYIPSILLFFFIFSVFHWNKSNFIYSLLLFFLMINILIPFIYSEFIHVIFNNEIDKVKLFKNIDLSIWENETKRKSIMLFLITLWFSYYYFGGYVIDWVAPLVMIIVIYIIDFINVKEIIGNNVLSILTIVNIKNTINNILHFFIGDDLADTRLTNKKFIFRESNENLDPDTKFNLYFWKSNFNNFYLNILDFLGLIHGKSIKIKSFNFRYYSIILSIFAIIIFLLNHSLLVFSVLLLLIAFIPRGVIKINSISIKRSLYFYLTSLVIILSLISVFIILSQITPKKLPDNQQVDNFIIDQNFNIIKAIENKPVIINDSVIYKHVNTPPLSAETTYPETFKAILNKEDHNFHKQHHTLPNLTNWHGVNWTTIFLGPLKGRGGSNLNNQIFRNLTGHKNNDIMRKIAENSASFILSQNYNTNQILSMYLSYSNFAPHNGKSGAITASESFFNKPISNLSEKEQYLLIYSLTGGNIFQMKTLDERTKKKIADFRLEHKIEKSAQYSHVLKGSITDNFSLLNSYLDQGLQTTNNSYYLSPELKSKILKKRLNYKTEEQVLANGYKQLLDFYLDRENPVKSVALISSIPKENQILLKKAEDKYLDYVESQNWEQTKYLRNSQNRITDTIKLYYGAIVINYKTGEIIGALTNAKNATAFFIEKSSTGSTIKPPLLAHNIFELGKGVREFKVNNDKHFDIGETNNLTEFLSKSGNSFKYNDDINWARKDITEKFDRKICKILYSELKTGKNLKKVPETTYDLENNYFLGQSREMGLLHIAQLYQSLFNEGVLIPLSPLQSYYDLEIDKTVQYNPFSFDKSIKKHQFFDRRTAIDVKNATRKVLDGTMINNRSLFTTNRFGKTGTTNETGISLEFENELNQLFQTDWKAFKNRYESLKKDKTQYIYSVLANDSILVITKVFYGFKDERKFRNSKLLPDSEKYYATSSYDSINKVYKANYRKFFPTPPGSSGSNAGKLASYILKDFENR